MGTKKKIQELKAMMQAKVEACEYGMLGCDGWAQINHEQEILDRYQRYVKELEEMENCFSEDYEPTAKEMFESLGYHEVFNDNYGIRYSKEIGKEKFVIEFVLWLDNASKIKHYMIYKQYILETSLNALEIKAINKQCEELGW